MIPQCIKYTQLLATANHATDVEVGTTIKLTVVSEKQNAIPANKKKGHIEKVCKAGQSSNHDNHKRGKSNWKRTPRRVKVVNEDSDESDAMGHIHEVNRVNKPRNQPIWITPKVDGKLLKMELDTGASVSLLSWTDYRKYFKGRKLKRSDISLKAFTGHPLVVKGKFEVRVDYGNQTHRMEIYVHSDTERNPILGREWLYQMKINWQVVD